MLFIVKKGVQIIWYNYRVVYFLKYLLTIKKKELTSIIRFVPTKPKQSIIKSNEMNSAFTCFPATLEKSVYLG